MTVQELRELSDTEVAQKVLTLKQQLFQLRVQAKLGRLEKGLEMRHVRRDIARCLTVQTERQHHPAPNGAPEHPAPNRAPVRPSGQHPAGRTA